MLNTKTIGWILEQLKHENAFISMVSKCYTYGLDYSL